MSKNFQFRHSNFEFFLCELGVPAVKKDSKFGPWGRRERLGKT
jgi:hypothetical protein